MKRQQTHPFGACLLDDGVARWRLWAPARDTVALELVRRVGDVERSGGAFEVVEAIAMTRSADGWHEAQRHGVTAGTLYRYRIDDDLVVPDPASRFNPFDVHGPSELIDPCAHAWSDAGWTGRPWHEAVIYEMHVGTFTPAGTFDAARERLAELAALGFTAIEVMPVADFPGTRNWGYDGVLFFAPEASYGRPEDLKRFVETAHNLGLMVLLDVVYNHFGPDGNYLHAYAPQFFDASRRTPWGVAINFDGPSSRPVREFCVHNALYWVNEYGFDGLRVDAVHALGDRSSPDLVEEMTMALRAGPGRERYVHVVLENDGNHAHYLERACNLPGPGGADEPRPRYASAQWNDDVHHALHVLLTAESDGYYADYADAPLERLGRAMAEGFIYQGDPSPYRGGVLRGEPSGHLPPTAFVNYLQTHDQVGNRAFGERLDALVEAERMPAALACILLGPQVPMLFMGEEYAASTPFLYFCDFADELGEAVRQGRREEFGRFESFRDPAAREAIPDPCAIETFAASKLRWHEREESPHRERLSLVRQMLGVRHALMPRYGRIRSAGRWSRPDGTDAVLAVRWVVADDPSDAPVPRQGPTAPARPFGESIILYLSFSTRPESVPTGTAAEVLFSHGLSAAAGPGRWTLGIGGVLLMLENGDS